MSLIHVPLVDVFAAVAAAHAAATPGPTVPVRRVANAAVPLPAAVAGTAALV